MRKEKELKARRWQDMAGNSHLEKRINAYLTSEFIARKNIPADECLTEARVVIQIMAEFILKGKL